MAEARTMYAGQLGSMVEGWISGGGRHRGRRVDSSWDLVTTVPSSRRPGRSPVDAIVDGVPSLCHLLRPLLVRGPRPIGHLQADRHGFVPAPGIDLDRLRGRAVLVLDDSVATGASAQGAAAALRLAGARVTGILVVGRAKPAAIPNGGEARKPA